MSRIPIRSGFPNPLGDSSQNSPVNSYDEFFIILMMTLPISIGLFTSLILTDTREAPEHSRTRQVILDVPETSRVDAQVTSENTTLNLQNL